MFERFAKQYFHSGMNVLEIGPDAIPSTYQRVVANADIHWLTADLACDIKTPRERTFARGLPSDLTYQMPTEYDIPAPSCSFDIIVSGQVIEHVRKIWLWMRELGRVCRPGGYVITIAPVSWPYHEAPIDCWRIYPEGLHTLCEDAGLDVVVSVFDSLEPRLSRRYYAGMTYGHGELWTFRRRLLSAIKRTINWPLPVAIDTIVIARKPEMH